MECGTVWHLRLFKSMVESSERNRLPERTKALDKKIERVSDRCERICGQKQSECFVNKKDQINCISDMVVNKTSSIMMALSASLQMDDSEFLLDTARESLADACELSNWIKYLQIVPNLLTLSTLVLDAENTEKRMEIRYPTPEEFEGRLNVIYDEMLEAKLVNFSQKGMQIRSAKPIEGGAVIKCHLIADIADGLKNPFIATVMYCVPQDGAYVSGVRISQMQNSSVFNFFSLVHQLMLDLAQEH